MNALAKRKIGEDGELEEGNFSEILIDLLEELKIVSKGLTSKRCTLSNIRFRLIEVKAILGEIEKEVRRSKKISIVE